MNGRMVSFFRRGAIVPLLASIVSSSPTPTLAQLTPDATLGSQTSQVNSIGSVDTITGGVQSGRALFHSFLDFNVSPGRSLYFQDPGVSHIFTRVTGRQPSQIQGKLGVVGEANLVLLNPNGILFGTGASLDLRGSFTATTAPTLKFLGGQEFSATAPQAAPLLTLSVPIGVQLGDPTPGSRITNRGTLVTGQDLSLSSDRLDLQGSLQAGRDLSLRALDTVQVRDTLAQPFLAKAGRNLEIQGDRGIDILALNHVQAPAFQSGNTLSLISDGLISGDARFSSQGNLQMRSRSGGLAKFTSLYDPILSTVGDVDLALDYTGASLLIEAGGNIRIQGRVEITTPDGAAPLLGEDAVLNQKPGLILRSGQTNLRYSGNSDSVPGSTAGLGLLSDPGITLGGDVVVSADGVIRLTSDNGGDLRTQLLRTERGEITLISDRNLTTNGQLVDVATYSGDGGQITATARSGNLSLGELRAFSQDVDRETRGGTIDLKAAGDVVLQAVDTTAYQGKGGNLTIAAGGKLTLASVATYGLISGDSGAVNLTAGDRTELGTIDTSAVTGRSGDVTVTTQGDLFIQNQLETSIYIQGRAGDINLAVRSLFLRDGAQIRSNSAYGGAGDSGKIAIAARDRIEMTGFGAGNRPTAIFNLVDLYSTGTGNDITITTGSLIMRDGSEILANNFGNGNGTRAGNITIQARDRISLQGSRYWPGNNEETGTGIGSNIAKGGLIQEGGLNRQGGTIDIQAQNLELLDGAYIATRLEKLSDGQSGNIRLKLGNAAQPGTLLLRGGVPRSSAALSKIPWAIAAILRSKQVRSRCKIAL